MEEDDRYKITFDTWNRLASLYQDKFMDMDLYNDTYDFLCNGITCANPKILEVGCGPGNISQYILSIRPDFNLTGIDVAENMVDLAQKNNPTAKFMVMDGRQLDELQGKYDAIICGFCLPYFSLEDSIKFIKDCSCLLANNGLLYISFVEGNYTDSTYKTSSSGDKVCFYYYSLEQVTNLLTTQHFKVIHLIHKNYSRENALDEIHTILIAKNK